MVDIIQWEMINHSALVTVTSDSTDQYPGARGGTGTISPDTTGTRGHDTWHMTEFFISVMEQFFCPRPSVSLLVVWRVDTGSWISRMNSNEDADSSLRASDPRILYSDSGFETIGGFSLNWMGLAIGLILLLLCKLKQFQLIVSISAYFSYSDGHAWSKTGRGLHGSSVRPVRWRWFPR